VRISASCSVVGLQRSQFDRDPNRLTDRIMAVKHGNTGATGRAEKNMTRRKALAQKKTDTASEPASNEPSALAVGLEMLKFGIDAKTIGNYIQSKTPK
jgi:hypothetical protein